MVRAEYRNLSQWPEQLTFFFSLIFKKYLFILSVPGLSCSTQDLLSLLQHVGSFNCSMAHQ